MAYSTEVNDKIINFFSRAQTRIADNAEEDVTLIYEGDTREYKQKFEDNLVETQDLSFFIFALDNQYNDWTEDEIVQYVDYFDVQYKLTNIPYVERDEYNLSIFIPTDQNVTSYNDLTDKPDLTVYAQKANNLSDLTNPSIARANLGLSVVAASGFYSDLSGTPSLATDTVLGLVKLVQDLLGSGADKAVSLDALKTELGLYSKTNVIPDAPLANYPGLAAAVSTITSSTTINEAISILEKATVLNSAAGTKVGTRFLDDFVRASLGASYTVVGTFTTAEIQNNKLRLAHSGSPDWSRYVYRNDYPTSDIYSDIEIDVDLVDITPANSAIGIRFHGYNSGRNYTCRLFTASGASQGRLDIQFEDSSTGQVTSGAYLAIAQGDSVTLKASVFKNQLFFQAKNNASGKIVFVEKTFPVNLAETYRQPNRWQQGIQMFAGTYDVTRLEYISNNRLFSDICYTGDSLTIGYNNVDYADTWRLLVSEELNKTQSTIAGGGNSSQDILDVLPEIIAVSPANVVMMIGQNDIAAATPLATIQSNISSIVTQLESESINVILLANIPNSDATQKDLADWILTTYPNQSVDLYYPFLSTTSTTVANTTYISSSHWTPTGNDAAAQILINELPGLLA